MKPLRAGWFLVLVAAATSRGGGGSAFAAAGEAVSEIRFTVLMSDEVVGYQTIRVDSQGAVHCIDHRERPGERIHLTSRFVLGSAGIPRAVEITGTGELSETVAERFSWVGSAAAWSNGVEAGRRELDRPAFYVALDGPPQTIALLARALLATPGGRLPLLPDGEASLERIGEHLLAGDGGPLRATLFAISGLGFAPTFVWLDAEGGLVAFLDGVLHVIRSGRESAAQSLEQAQDAAGAALSARRSRELAHRPQGALVLRGVGLFDAVQARVMPEQTVVVQGNRIVAVGPRAAVAAPAGAEVVDGRGRTLLPGLWDLHVHTAATDGLLYLAAGVTGVRDLGNQVEKVVELRRRWDSGEAAGPRMALAGYLNGPGIPGTGRLVEVRTAAEARAAVDRYAELGYVQVKLYNELPRELVPAIVARAKQRGMRVSGHLPSGLAAREAVEAGFDEIQHLNALFREWLPPAGAGGRLERAKACARLDLTAPQVEGLIALLARRKIAIDPTLLVFEESYGERSGGLSRGWATVAHRLPLQERRQLLRFGLLNPPGQEETLGRCFQKYLALTGRLHAAGVPVLAGTDAMAGFALLRELELHVAAGIPASRVLQSATLEAARVAGRGGELGSIEAGRLADLVLVEGDPSQDISNLRRGVLTVKDGLLYHTEQLHSALGLLP